MFLFQRHINASVFKATSLSCRAQRLAHPSFTLIDDQLFEDRVREFTITKHQQVEISTYWLTDPLIASLDADGSVIIDWPTGFWARWTYRSYDPPQ